MINRELIPAILLTYDDTLDEYGQPRKTKPSEGDVKVTKPKLYRHSPEDDIRFNEVQYTSLTFNKSITDANELKIGDTIYSICFANNDGRLAQLFLKIK